MPRFYCDYCDAYLTHDSMSGRQQHIRGKHDAVTVHTAPKHVFMFIYFNFSFIRLEA